MPLSFIVNFEHISHFVLAFLMLTLNKQLPAGNPSIIPPQDILAAAKYFKYEVIFKISSISSTRTPGCIFPIIRI